MAKPDHILSCTLPSNLEQLKCIESMTAQAAERCGLSDDQADNLAIAVTEAVGNAIVHGNKMDPEKKVRVRYELNPDAVRVTVSDEGRGFDPNRIANPLDPDNLLKESGRGVFILKQLMDDVRYEFTDRGTTIHMTLNLGSGKSGR